MNRFDYIAEKIENSSIDIQPFEHIYIKNLFKPDDFEEIVSSREISISNTVSDSDLFNRLFEEGYKIIKFPGCVADKDYYMQWHENKETDVINNDACDGFGMTLRLIKPSTDILVELNHFLNSEIFNQSLAKKFNIDFNLCDVDNGLQKYLDGYEISPHPDIRNKALTYMVNINPKQSNDSEYHTKYLSFKSEYKYVQEFWKENKKIERSWVPWKWCDVQKEQRENNSIVVFSPNDISLHGIKANYNHHNGQRTQLYGNFWYKEQKELIPRSWQELDLLNLHKYNNDKNNQSAKDLIKKGSDKKNIHEVKFRK
tara:strand:- start:16075 stop:17013 length:939 start_codon:yes stop_codon:yes gene_type:complete